MSYASLIGLPEDDTPSWWQQTRAELDMYAEPMAELDASVARFGESDPEAESDGDVLVLIYEGAWVEWLPDTRHMRDRDGRSINRCGMTPCPECELLEITLGAGFTLDEAFTHI